MERFISKAVRWMIFIPAAVVGVSIAQKVLIKCVEQAFVYAPSFGMFLLLLIPGLIVWFVIGAFIYSFFKTLAGICPSAKGAKITLIVVSLFALSSTYFHIIEANHYPFFQDFGIFIWAHSLYSFIIQGAVERHEKELKEVETREPELSLDLLDDIPSKAA